MSIGDELLVQGNNGLVPANVTNVASLMMQGYTHTSLLIYIQIGFTFNFWHFKQ